MPDASTALTIAGSDPSGGAGVQADLKTFHQHGVYGMSVITLLTVQNTRSVSEVRILEPEFILAQLDAVLSDIPPRAAKTGALGDSAVIEAIASRAPSFDFPLVVDPVMVSKHGARLIAPDAVGRLRDALLPHAFLVTPNRQEAEILSGLQIETEHDMKAAAEVIAALGATHVLIKGGHFTGDDACDLMFSSGEFYWFAAARVESLHTHGTGCALSAAITARLALGENALDAVRGAKAFITEAIRTAPGLGGGCGPTNLFASTEEAADAGRESCR